MELIQAAMQRGAVYSSLATSQAATKDRVSLLEDPHSLIREGLPDRTAGTGQAHHAGIGPCG